ncbi:MAG: LEA type 2 family protein [Gammaproteobacteria bacterium]
MTRRGFAIAGLALLLAGCVSLPEDFRQPGVSVVSVKPRVLNSMTPEFDILLRVTNPNRKALEIAGLTYRVYLADSKVVEGVASDLPRIDAYGEAEVMLRARADLLGSLDVLSRLMDNPGAPVEYRFDAEIDIGTFYPMIRVERAGTLRL